ncbi:Bardet-Biedl syndrome 10 protein [Heterodontus francisci]|uniref:Bardet-Biedl syndrome 10 protein n=1 Tax=Heterodontus francisci TaxID=7792 RepID=UPI00355AE722
MCRVEMQAECVMDIENLVRTAETLENIVLRCFGPNGGQVLFVRGTGDILITRDGCRILESLVLEHPAARLMVRSVLAHCSVTGDGAKSFILLLAAMLRGVRAETGGERPASVGARRFWIAAGLARLEREVLERVLERHLAPHCASALSLSGGQLHLPREWVARVLVAYFGGKVGAAHATFLSQLACDFLWRLGDGEMERTLSLAADCFPGLQGTVPGLPMGSSRVLEGLLLSRGFALRCGEGETRVLVTTSALLPPLTEADCTLWLESPSGLAEARGWARARAEEALVRLRELGVGLLLSGPRQPACVLELALRHGVSLVDCLPDEDLALVTRLTGAEPLDWVSEAQLGDTVPASFARPAPLGPHGQVLVGFPALRGFWPHCLAVCAPALGLAEQHRDAIHGAFKLLRLLLSTPRGLGREKDRHEAGDLGRGSERQGAGDLGRGSERHGTGDLRRGSEGQGTGDLGRGSEGQGTGELGRAEEQTEVEMGISGEGRQHHSQPVGQPAQRVQWELRDCELPAGCVLPPGGAFELLMNHYLQHEAGSWQQPNTRTACKIVADALLNVPRHLHPQAGHGRGFLQARADFAASLRGEGAPPMVEGPMEVVAAKRHLLISVIQCLRNLLTIDHVIPVRGKLGEKLQAEREELE